MVLACALLFSCATDNGADSSASENNLTLINAGSGIPEEESFIAAALADDPVIGLWASKYEFALNPVLNGVLLITDNAAFDKIPADVKERKDKAEALCDENCFYDAWLAYGESDSEYIVALKIMHLIDSWSDTYMHQDFVLTNLPSDLDLYDYRENPTLKGETVFWDPVEEAEAYVKKNCGGVMPHIIELALGCYYQDAAITFGDEWIMPLEDAYETSADYFMRAFNAGVYNDYAVFKAIDSLLYAGFIEEGLELVHCLELGEPDYCFHFYQEARAYMCLEEYEKALSCAARAILYSTIPDDVSAAAGVMADAFMYGSSDVKNALAVLEAAKPYMGEVYYLSSVFMNLDILMYAKNRYPGADYDGQIIQTLDDAFAYEPDDSDYLWELADYFYNYGFIDLGITWIEGALPGYSSNDLASGNLNFELGQLYLQFSEWQKALDCFNKAEIQLKAAGAYNLSTSNIPYYQDVCQKALKDEPVRNGI